MIRWELGGVAMNGDFPRTVDAIDNEWLSEVLGAEVTRFSTENLEGGVLSDAFRLHDIAYAGSADGAPPSVVVKLPNAIPARRESAVASGAYAKELNPAASAYTYEMLLQDYLFGFLFWWSNLVSLGTTVLPMFDEPEGRRMKALWGQGLVWMLIAMTDHDCLSLIKRIQSEVKG